MRQIKVLAGAGALIGAALVGGTLISAVLAAPSESDATTSTTVTGGAIPSDYVDAYLDALAAELGVERTALGPAAQAAASAAIDTAVAAGDIEATRGEELKADIAALENPERLLVGHGFMGGRGGWWHLGGIGLRLDEAIDAAAGALGLQAADVLQALRDGTGLQEQAEAQGVDYATVSDAVLSVVQTAVDEAVSNGDITQERVDEIIARVTEWLDAGGDLPFGRFGPGGFGPGFGHRH